MIISEIRPQITCLATRICMGRALAVELFAANSLRSHSRPGAPNRHETARVLHDHSRVLNRDCAAEYLVATSRISLVVCPLGQLSGGGRMTQRHRAPANDETEHHLWRAYTLRHYLFYIPCIGAVGQAEFADR
jgi:hypothetical protein